MTQSKLRRRRSGKGFYYLTAGGMQVKEPRQIERIKKLAIPPAWENVEIAPGPQARIQATGYDAAGRKQYRYSDSYRRMQERRKFDRILAFANALPMMRTITSQHVRQKQLSREKVLACMVRLIDQAYFRVGSERYAKENQTYGLATMRSRHLTIKGDTMIFSYVGKSNQEHVQSVEDGRLAKIVAELDDLPGYEIFKYYNDQGRLVDVTSRDLNAYIKEVMGYDFSAKDFRTWAGTLIAAVALAEADRHPSDYKRKREVATAIKKVSKKLGNTPAIAKASYVDPRVVEHYLRGSTITWYLQRVQQFLAAPEMEHLSYEEVAVLKLLSRRLRRSSADRR